MVDAAYAPRLKQLYNDVLRGDLTKQFNYSNEMQVPALDKVVLNMGIGQAVGDSKKVQIAVADLALIAGQKPVITLARKSIATFKLRDGMAIGAKVTLRKNRMYDFIDRLVTIALPRVRDFRGLSLKSFDGRGNFALGIKEHIIFPEIDYDKVDAILGLDVVVCTTANSDEEARALLKGFNFPFMEPSPPPADAAPEEIPTEQVGLEESPAEESDMQKAEVQEGAGEASADEGEE